MAHDVYLSYDEKDLESALNVCETLEANGLKCWMKNRDVDSDSRVKSIIKAIKDSRVLLLIHSKNSKTSQFINNEVNEAFDADRSILVYQIDDSKLEGSLEFFLKSKPKVKAYPNPEEKNDDLVEKTKTLVNKQKKDDRNITNIIKENKKLVIAGLIALVVIVAVGFIIFNGENGGSSSVNVGDYKLKITDFNREDVRKQDLDWNYSYSIIGSISPSPDKQSGVKIVVDFYDKTGKLVDTTETPFEDAQISGSGFLFGSVGSDNKDITYVDVQLMDSDNVIIAQDDSQR